MSLKDKLDEIPVIDIVDIPVAPDFSGLYKFLSFRIGERIIIRGGEPTEPHVNIIRDNLIYELKTELKCITGYTEVDKSNLILTDGESEVKVEILGGGFASFSFRDKEASFSRRSDYFGRSSNENLNEAISQYHTENPESKWSFSISE